mgnify:CR=1 FL=1
MPPVPNTPKRCYAWPISPWTDSVRRIDELLSNHSNDHRNPSNQRVRLICVALIGPLWTLSDLYKKAGIAI